MQPTNLQHILEENSKITSKGISFIEGGDKEEFVSYNELYNLALQVLSFLQSKGLKSKDELVFQLDNNKDFIIVFWACILGGIIPIPLTLGRNDDHRQKLFNVWKVLNHPYLIISPENQDKLKSHAEQYGHKIVFRNIRQHIINAHDIYSVKKPGGINNSSENDIAYIQFSSGSTGDPKGVTLTHKNLITNANAILKGIKSPLTGDTFFTWMPLTHDMGLIGFHITPTIAGWQHFIMPTDLFIRRPSLWLQKISQHKITFTASPNFGYRYVINRFDDKSNANLDLSSLRLLANGAEPISASLCTEFTNKFISYGLRKNVIFPVYGLAEASLAVSFTEPNDEIQTIKIDRKKLNCGNKIIQTKNRHGLSFVNVGKVLDNCSINITDDSDKPVDENTIGRVKIKGENVTTGYYNNPSATKKIIANSGWLDTGDLGFIHNECLYITGRAKDILFINGQNYYPYDIERSLEVIDGIELGKIVVAGCTNEKSGQEEVFVFVLFKGKTEKFIDIIVQVKKHINQQYGFEPDEIIQVREIPKTTSGKVQRYKLIEELRNNAFDDVIKDISKLMQQKGAQNKTIAPANNIEKILYEIWASTLSHNNFDITNDFFEIGGNSLKGAEVLALIHREFGIELDYNILFRKTTIQQLAKEIENHETSRFQPISKTQEQDGYPLSSAQRRLYYIWEVDKFSIAYNIPVAFQLTGELDKLQLGKALNNVIERHEILRTSFVMADNEPRQVINEPGNFELTVTKINPNDCKSELRKRVRPFNLNSAPLFRIELFEISQDSHIFFLDFHHIISDGVSISIFIDELLEIYYGESLNEPEIQYKDYVIWEKENLSSDKITGQGTYWKKLFEDEIPVLQFPSEFARPLLMDYKGEKSEYNLNSSLTNKLKLLAKQENTSLFTLLFTVYTIFLSKYTNQEDIVVGLPTAVRNHTQLRSLMGMFVNNLAIRSLPEGNTLFKDYLKKVKGDLLKALDNRNYPFEKVVEQIGQKRDISRNSLFDTMFIYQNMELPQMKKNDLSVERYFFDPGFSKYDISFEIFEQSEEITYYIEYSTALFKKETIDRFAVHFENLLRNTMDTPDASICDLALLSKEEVNRHIVEFNNTKTDYENNKPIHQLIEEQAILNGNNIAVSWGGNQLRDKIPGYGIKELTYKELNDKANQLANFLRKNGIDPDTSVAVILDRSPELIISILGILKAGGCYIPIDKDLPDERIRYILEDSHCRMIITTSDFESRTEILELANNLQLSISNIDHQDLYCNEPTTITNVNTACDLTYIIYTSGTTGRPKGAMIEHRSLVNYATWANKMYVRGEKTSFPLYTSISFDLTITSVFVPLISGNTIVIYPERNEYLPIENVIADNQVNIVKATPSHLKMFTESHLLKDEMYKSNIKRFIVGGESLTAQLANDIYRIFKNKVEIYNEYGPTEATVGCMIYKYNKGENYTSAIPIGIPIDNAHIYLLDKYQKPVPTGVSGEIYISGDCLARGYLFNPMLSAEKFLQNPFFNGQKMYKTGDLARKMYDGNIEFIGRTDKQVKINGYRIELEEIEQHIIKYKSVKEALVVEKKDDNGGSYLCAYIRYSEPSSPTSPDTESSNNIQDQIADIRQFLSNRLPHYMIPKYILPIDFIPLTKNGKIDYKLLPEPTIQSKTIKTEARNDIENVMVDVWQNVLAEKEIGITDNFFELGGDSIKAVQIASRLFDKNIAVNVKDILTYQTIERLSLYAEITDNTNQYEQGIVEGEVGLNPIQKWFFEQNFENPNFYNQSVLLEFKKPINKEFLQKTFNILIKHHDGLRLNYNPEKKIMFYNNTHLDNEFVIEEYSPDKNNSTPSQTDKQITNLCQKVKNSLDIINTLLIKAAIIKKAKSDLLFITAHHLIIDGVSWRILLEDLYKVYRDLINGQNIQLPKKTASLKEWYEKLRLYSEREAIKQEISYWRETDDSKFRIQSNNIINTCFVKHVGKISSHLDANETEFLLKDAHKVYNTNVEILLVTALVRTLEEWTGNNEIVVEMESHGRHLTDIETSRTTGWFTSLFPVKFVLDKDDIGESIKQVKEKIKKIPGNGIGYGILKYLNNVDIETFLFDVRFNYLGQFSKELNNDVFNYSSFDTGSEIDSENSISYHIEINCMVINGELNMEINYNSNVIKGETIKRLNEKYFEHLNQIINHLRNEDDIHFTPSDFDAGELDEEDLKILFE